MDNNKQVTKNRHKEFMLSFFMQREGYEEKEVNGYWLIKTWDGNTKDWTVNLFSQESYRNYKNAKTLFG